MKNKRPHAKLIKAWADGARIQFKDYDGNWMDCWNNEPKWEEQNEYRIRPDNFKVNDTLELYACTVGVGKDYCLDFTLTQHVSDNLRLTIDRQHGTLLKAEVIK